MTDPLAQSAQLLDVASTAAIAAGNLSLGAFRSTMDLGLKRDFHDVVTEHDRAAEEVIREAILGKVPDSAIVGEEGGRTGNGSLVWYVDPIDGTVNFARGIAHWCVSIAVAVDGRTVAGVVFDPVAGHLFSAHLGGAWLNGSPLEAPAREREQQAVLLTSFPNHRHLDEFGPPALDAQIELLNSFQALRNLGSGALHLAYVAAGWADAVLGFSTNSWDVAAGMLIVEQAGGRCRGLRDGRDVDFVHTAPDYLAVGGGADYPTLDRVAVAMSERRTSATRRLESVDDR